MSRALEILTAAHLEKERRDTDVDSSMDRLGKTLQSITENRQQNRLLDLKERELNKSSGLEEMLTRGKVADSLLKEVELGTKTPQQARDLMSGLSLLQNSANLNNYLTSDQQASSGSSQSSVNTTTAPAPAQASQNAPQNDLFATKTNVVGVPKELQSESGLKREEAIKSQSAISKKLDEETSIRIQGAQNSAQDFETFSQTYQLSLAELKERFGESVDDATLSGWGLRQIAKVSNAVGFLPETKAFSDSIQSFATPLAKSAGEDRLTNEDIVRFTNTLQDSLGSPSETNANKMRNLLIGWRDNKGADLTSILKTFDESGGILKSVSSKVRSFKSDVKKAGSKIEGKNSNLEELARQTGVKILDA